MSLDVTLTIPRDEPTRADLAIQLLREHKLDEFAELIEARFDHGPEEVFASNITSNLVRMAEAARMYQIVWRPALMGITKAHQLIEPLAAGLQRLREGREEFQKFNPSNGWGSYDDFVAWCSAYLVACITYPDADVATY